MASREAAGLSSGAGQASSATPSCGGALPTLPGNGAQQGFTTGATRSTDAGKVDFEGHINPEVLAVFGEFMNAHRVQRDGRIRASDNWQQGIPIYRYVKSLIRHTLEFWRMWRGTPVINPDNSKFFTFREVTSAIMFNVMGVIFEAVQRHPQFLDAHLLPTWQRQQWEQEDAVEPTKAPAEPSRKERDDAHARLLNEQRRVQQETYGAAPTGVVGSDTFTCPQYGEKNCCPGASTTHQLCINIAAMRSARMVGR